MVNFKYYKSGATFDSSALNNDDIAFVEESKSLYTHGEQYKFVDANTIAKPDWNETDTNSPAYIQNKPSVVGATFEYDAQTESIIIAPASSVSYNGVNEQINIQ